MPLKDIQEKIMDGVESDVESDVDVFSELSDERSASRFQVYQNAYRIRLSNALQTVFPALLRLLGKKAFAALSQDYLSAYPPREASLLNYPKNIPDLLSTELGRDNSVVELAVFERYAYYLPLSSGSDVLTLERWRVYVESDKANDSIICAADHVHFLELSYNTEQAWLALRDKDPALDSMRNPGVVWLWKTPDAEIHFLRLDSASASFARLLLSGLSFERACDSFLRLCGDEEQALTVMSSCMNHWLSLGLLRHVS